MDDDKTGEAVKQRKPCSLNPKGTPAGGRALDGLPGRTFHLNSAMENNRACVIRFIRTHAERERER